MWTKADKWEGVTVQADVRTKYIYRPEKKQPANRAKKIRLTGLIVS